MVEGKLKFKIEAGALTRGAIRRNLDNIDTQLKMSGNGGSLLYTENKSLIESYFTVQAEGTERELHAVENWIDENNR